MKIIAIISSVILIIVGIVFIGVGFCNNALFTAAGAMFAAAGLFFSVYCNLSERNNKNSEFYLTQIKEYFKDASIFISSDNNNIKWHQGVNLLKTAEKLSKNLTEVNHQVIYITEYINTGFKVLFLLRDIDNYKFFYGLVGYQAESDKSLYEKSDLGKTCFRINPSSLIELDNFIDKAGTAWFDHNENKSSYQSIFSSGYFNKDIGSFQSSAINKVPVIYEYFENFNKNESKKSEN